MKTTYRHRQLGITLVELLITLAIMALIAGMVGPSFKQFLQRSRVATESDILLSAINYARSEAIKRGNPVSICAGTEIVSGKPCNASDWGQGWTVYSDVADDRSRTIRILQTHEKPLASLIKSEVSQITFNSSGIPVVKGNFTVCDRNEVAEAMSTSMTVAGFAKTSKGELIKCQ